MLNVYYVGNSKSNAFCFYLFFYGNPKRYKEQNNSVEKNSQLQKTVFWHSQHHWLCIFISNEHDPSCQAHNNLHRWRWPALAITTAETHHPLHHCAHIHCLVSINIQQTSVNVSGCHFFHHGGIQWHTFASYIPPCQVLFCQSAPLLLCVIWQQDAMGCWWEGSTSIVIPPKYISDVTGQHNIGGITFGEVILNMKSHMCGLLIQEACCCSSLLL